jgi:hypothetical protein
VSFKHPNRFARLNEERLVGLELSELANDGVVGLPGAGSAARAAVDDEILGPFRDLGVEVVHQHAHGGLLRPPETGDLGTSWRSDLPGLPTLWGGGAKRRWEFRVGSAAHARAPVTDSAALSTAPLRISASAAASSGAR